jgi:SAM-dependent methyltransferase
MSHNQYLDKHLLEFLPRNLDGYEILDAACGYGTIGHLIRMRTEGTPIIAGVDIWKPYIQKLDKLKIYNKLFVADIKDLPFKDEWFDFTIAFEYIEHEDYLDSFKGLNELIRVTKGLLIVSTPDGETDQDDADGNEYQRHKFAWNEELLKIFGFKTMRVPMYPMNRITRLLRRFKPRTDHIVVGWLWAENKTSINDF